MAKSYSAVIWDEANITNDCSLCGKLETEIVIRDKDKAYCKKCVIKTLRKELDTRRMLDAL